MHEVYVSVDIEATGNCPPKHSMFAYGAVSWNTETGESREFLSNVAMLPGSTWDAGARSIYDDNLLSVLTDNPEHPTVSMRRFLNFLEALGERPIFVGYPASFDFTWIYWYMHNYVGKCPFGFQALDLKSCAWMLNAIEFRKTTKKVMPKRWFDESLVHTHNPLDDAKEQMYIFKQIYKEKFDLVKLMQAVTYPPIIGS